MNELVNLVAKTMKMSSAEILVALQVIINSSMKQTFLIYIA